MKNKTVFSFVYLGLIIVSIILEYLLIVFSVFYFFGRQDGKEYDKEYFITTLVIVGLLALLFIIFYCFFKLFKILLRK